MLNGRHLATPYTAKEERDSNRAPSQSIYALFRRDAFLHFITHSVIKEFKQYHCLLVLVSIPISFPNHGSYPAALHVQSSSKLKAS